jgi:hypothetical protein
MFVSLTIVNVNNTKKNNLPCVYCLRLAKCSGRSPDLCVLCILGCCQYLGPILSIIGRLMIDKLVRSCKRLVRV